MTAKITLTWDNGSSEHVDQIVYRSTQTFTVDNLPTILARVGRNARGHIDTDIVMGNTYFYAVASENAVGEVLLSSVISVVAESSDGDPHWDKVVSLLHFDGDLTDGAGTTTWAFMNDADTYGTPMFGTGALNSKTGWIYSSVGLPLSGDFTIELFSYQPALKQVFLFDFRPYAISGPYPVLFTGNAGELYFFINSAIVITAPAGTIVTDVYKHIEVSRSGGVIRLFYDGNLVGSAANSNPMGSGSIAIGAGHQPNRLNHNGYIDGFRVTDGIARNTANFTPPTEPFPNF